MKLGILCRAAGLRCPYEHEADEVSAIVTDSRKASEGCMFVCIRGLREDGHRFIADAVRRGGRWIVAEHDTLIGCDKNVVYLFTDDTRRAAAYLFDALHGHPTEGMKLIGVTGTNGKTTVSHLIRHMITTAGFSCGLIGTMGCSIDSVPVVVCDDDRRSNMTTPDPEYLYEILARMKRAGVRYVVMEVSSHALALQKTAPLSFDVGVFTNLTPEHLDFHRTMEEYANTKASFFLRCGHAVINLDDAYADQMIKSARAVTTCSRELLSSDVHAEEISISETDGVRYRMRTPDGEYDVQCRIPAQFTVMNSMQALLAVHRVGIALEDACDALAEMPGVRGRMEHLPIPESLGFFTIIDYAHTPDALENLLQSVRKTYANHRIVLLFGCGGDRDRLKRPMMGRIASAYADAIILTSDNSRSEEKRDILTQILAGMEFCIPCTVICDRAEAIAYAVRTAERGDVLLLAGKGHEEYEIDGIEKRPFSERALVAGACLEKLTKFERTERNEMP